MAYRVAPDELERRAFGSGVAAGLFNGAEHGLTDLSLMFGEVQPGSVVALHRHAYDELFIIQQGRATFTIDGSSIDVSAGDLVVIPAGAAHTFVNTGDVPLLQTAAQAAGAIVIEWLE